MKIPYQSEAAFDCGMAMHACLTALAHQLADAQSSAIDARDAMAQSNRYLAIGTLTPHEEHLPECDALLRAILTLQTWRNRLPSDERAAEGGVK